jgi:hypothetical protein
MQGARASMQNHLVAARHSDTHKARHRRLSSLLCSFSWNGDQCSNGGLEYNNASLDQDLANKDYVDRNGKGMGCKVGKFREIFQQDQQVKRFVWKTG